MTNPSVLASLSVDGGNSHQGQSLVYRGKKPEVSPENVRCAITMSGVTLRYDAFGCYEIIEGLPDFGPELDDAAMDHLYLLIWQRYELKVGWDDFKRIVRNFARENTFHPVRNYLDSLKWDGIPRIDTWLQVYGNAEPTPFIKRVGALTLMAVVKRIYEPGCKFDEMLVLENPKQGGNKSSAWSVLAVKRQWFLDDLPLTAMTREVLEKTRGKWVIEAAELIGMQSTSQTTKVVTKIKSFLSRQTDEARWVYKDTVMHKPREFVIVGSTNETKWMFDATGNRRFWPAPAGPFDLDKLERDRDQLWAEAVHRVTAGESIRLEEALWSVAEDEQKKRMVVSPIQDKLENLLGEVEQGKITSAALMDYCFPNGVQSPKRASEIKTAMEAIGWRYKEGMKFGKTTHRGYFKVDEQPALTIKDGEAWPMMGPCQVGLPQQRNR